MNTVDKDNVDPFKNLRDKLREFAAERDWDQFHLPKNLAIALSIEAAELLEHFQWLSETDSECMTDERLKKMKEEMADVLLYLIRLSDKLKVDLVQVAEQKIDLNAQKYPIDKARGSSKKYADLQ